MTSLELDAIMKHGETFQALYKTEAFQTFLRTLLESSDPMAVETAKRLIEAHNDRDALALVVVNDPNTYVPRMIRGIPMFDPASNVVQFPEPQSGEVQKKKNQTVILADDIQKYGFAEALRRSEKR